MMINYTKFNIPASAIYVKEDNKIHVTYSHPSAAKVYLLALNPSNRQALKIASFKGSRSFLLKALDDKMFVGVDNKLLVTNGRGFWKTVLRGRKSSNIFWHLTTSKDGMIYVQEYGEPPTGIYASIDGEEWDLLVTSNEIDNRARHFHSLAYDQYRDMLIATIGDWNYVRIAASADGGKNWRPVYKGAWQVLPIAVLKDRIVFGMDSGIARGGLVIWLPSKDRFEVLHLRWGKNRVKLMQMVDLKLLSNNVWVAALGTPQAIIASSNLTEWYLVYIDGFDDTFHQSMAIGEGENVVSFITGKSVIFMQKNDLAKYFNLQRRTIYEHKALLETVKGVGYTLKRKLSFAKSAR